MFVDLQGFEPQITGPKPAVLPLHHRSKMEMCRLLYTISYNN